VILQGLSGRSEDVELTGSTKWFGDVSGNHGGEVPAQRELEREVRDRDPRAEPPQRPGATLSPSCTRHEDCAYIKRAVAVSSRRSPAGPRSDKSLRVSFW
jgi:hypothetical protein